MDGVFMKKFIGRCGICFLFAVLFWGGTLISDRQRLNDELIRLHVVANSDSSEDQHVKLLVRDAVTKSLSRELQNVSDVQQAMQYMEEKLPDIREIAEETLYALGYQMPVNVSLCREAFDTRVYDSFTLPAGIYKALRIVIGEGSGKNWWCVVFPAFCVPVSGVEFEHVAAGAGFPQTLNHALTGEPGYELRFGLLDAMGKLENILFGG